MKKAIILIAIIAFTFTATAANSPEITDFTVSPNDIQPNEEFSITVRADDTETGNAEYPGILWLRVEIGDITKTLNCEGEQDLSCERTFEFEGLQASNYDAEITAKDTDFLTSSIERTVNIEQENQPPNSPELISPVNEEIQTAIPTFEWSGSDPDGDNLDYTVIITEYYGNSVLAKLKPEEFESLRNVKSGKKVSIRLPEDESLEDYSMVKWKVITKDSEGAKAESQTALITLNIPKQPPKHFSLSSPGNGKAAVNVNPKLKWEETSDPDGGSIDYTVEIAGEQFKTSKTSLDLSNKHLTLQKDTEYKWSVTAEDDEGQTTETETWNFITESDNKGGGNKGEASIASYGPSGETQNPVTLWLNLTSNEENYNCWKSNNQLVKPDYGYETEMSYNEEKDRFELVKNYESWNLGNQDIVYFQCFNQNSNHKTEVVKTTFTPKEQVEQQTENTRIVDIKNTENRIEKGETTRFKAKIYTNKTYSNLYTEFFVDNSNYFENAEINDFSKDEIRWIKTETISWKELKNDYGTGDHDLTAKLRRNQLIDKKSKENAFKVVPYEEESDRIESWFNWQPNTPYVGKEVTFTQKVETENNIKNYEWTVSGEEKPDEPTVTHVFQERGKHLVSLNVTDTEGNWDQTTRKVYVYRKPITCDIHTTLRVNDSEIRQGEKVKATIQLANDATGQKVDVKLTRKEARASAGTTVISETYNLEGEQDTKEIEETLNNLERDTILTLTVKPHKCSGTAVRTEEITVLQPEEQPNPEFDADFKWTPPTPYKNQEVTFKSTSQGGRNGIQNYTWKVGENTYNGNSFHYTFKETGPHQVQLIIKSGDKKDKVTKTVYVESRPKTCDIHTNMKLTRYQIDRGETIKAPITISNDGSTQRVTITLRASNSYSGTGRQILHKENIKITGQKTFRPELRNLKRDTVVTLTVDMEKGPCSGQHVITKEVVVLQPEQEPHPEFDADFTWTPPTPEAGTNITFRSTSQGGRNGIQNYTWHIRGAPRYGNTAHHVFQEPGNYQVQLVIEGPGDSRDAKTKTVHVEPKPVTCELNTGNLHLNPDTIQEEETTEAEITVTNDGNTPRGFTLKWMKGSNYIASQHHTLEPADSQTYRQTITAERETGIRAVIETDNQPCGYSETVKYQPLTVLHTSQEPIDDPVNEGEAELTVNVENQDGDKLDAQVSMDNGESYTGFTGSDGEKTFTVKPGDYEVTASKHDYTTETREISLEDGEEKNVTITLEQLEDSNTANLEVIVENEEGERLEDASVAVENGDSKTDSTDSDGESRFSLEPGDYTISVSKPGYSSKDKTIELEEGDSETEVFTLGEQGEKAIEIQSISYPDTVCRGQSFTADVTVKNQGGFHEMVTLTGTGLGSINIGERFSLDQNAEKTSELVFTDVQGSGTEEFEVTATNHDTDKETRTINVKSCVTTTPQKEQARGITMSVEPQEVVVGNSVHVKGYVNGIKGSANVEIRLNGERKARVATQPDGFYEVYLKPGEVGDATISATTKGASASRTIKVVPTATVDSVEAPRKVFEGKKFEVCTSVYSQVTPKVYLIRNNKVLKTKNQAGDVCFQTKAYKTGTQKFTVKALAGGRGNSAYTTVEVLPMRSEVSSFSDQVASVESEEGLIKVELYNTHDELRRYHLSLEGLPSTWQGQSQKEAVLNTGESETVYFYLTPQEAGDRDPVVKVETDGNTIYRQKIDLVTGGIKEPREQGFLSSLADLLPF